MICIPLPVPFHVCACNRMPVVGLNSVVRKSCACRAPK